MSKQPASFLPEEYLRRKADSRSLIINLVLFGGVLCATIGAFVVSNRQWNQVRTERAKIDAEWKAEELKIEQLRALESQKTALLQRASVTAALLERVPRSVLMAELINRMPENVTITQLDMVSKRVVEQAKPDAAKAEEGKSLIGKLAAGKDDKAPVVPKPPRLEFAIKIEGTSLSDTEVADYQAALKNSPLLDRVDLVSTEELTLAEVPMRKFRLEAQIRFDADAAAMQPPRAENVRDAMNNVALRRESAGGAGENGALWSGLFGKARTSKLRVNKEGVTPSEPASSPDKTGHATVPTNP